MADRRPPPSVSIRRVNRVPKKNQPRSLGVGDRSGSLRGVVEQAIRTGCMSIADTYTEPTIFYESALTTARLASDAGLGNIFVTNGFIALDALRQIAPYLNAANIDLKSVRDSYDKKLCGARLQPVLAAFGRTKRRASGSNSRHC